MIRLLLLLCFGMFLMFMIAGQDRGQLRYGLMQAGNPPVAAEITSAQNVASAEPAPAVAPEVFVPAQTVAQGVAEPVADAAVEAAVAEAVTETVTETAEPQATDVSGPLVRYVAVNSANVRSGPAKDFDVLEKLARGEAVTVVSSDEDPEGWTLIRIEGDGLEGYVSTPLLADAP